MLNLAAENPWYIVMSSPWQFVWIGKFYHQIMILHHINFNLRSSYGRVLRRQYHFGHYQNRSVCQILRRLQERYCFLYLTDRNIFKHQ